MECSAYVGGGFSASWGEDLGEVSRETGRPYLMMMISAVWREALRQLQQMTYSVSQRQMPALKRFGVEVLLAKHRTLSLEPNRPDKPTLLDEGSS